MRTDPRVEYDRQEVTALVGSAWREPVSVRYLGRFNPRYEVPGRNKDGSDPDQPQPSTDTGPLAIQPPPPETPPRENAVPRVLKVIGLVLVAIVAVAAWFFLWLARTPGEYRSHPSRPRKPGFVGKVTGGPNCLALGFADTARANPGRLWLAWSPSWLALVSSTGQSHVLWHCRGNARPAFDRERGRLVWPDGSVVSF